MRVIVVGAGGGIGGAVCNACEALNMSVRRIGRELVESRDTCDAIVFAQGTHWNPWTDNMARMVNLCDLLLDANRRQIVVTLSGGGVGGPMLKEPASYTATKAGVVVWTEWMALRYSESQWFCVAPGRTATKLTSFDGVDPKIPAAFIVKLLSGKYGHLSGSLLAAQRDDLDTMKPMKLRRVECP